MQFAGRFEDLKSRGFEYQINQEYIFKTKLKKSEFLIINTLTRKIEVSDENLLNILKKEEVEE